MHSFCLLAMVGAVASTKDIYSTARRELETGIEYEGFQNVIESDYVRVCTTEDCDEAFANFSVATTWNEDSSGKIYFGLIADIEFNEEAFPIDQE